MILLSFSNWFVAEVSFGYYNEVLKVNPSPWIAELFYFVSIFSVLWLRILSKTYKGESLVNSSLIAFSVFAFYIFYISFFYIECLYDERKFGWSNPTFLNPFFDLIFIVAGAAHFFREKDVSLNKEYLTLVLVTICGCFFFIANLMFGFNDLFVPSLKCHFADLFFCNGVYFGRNGYIH